MPDGQQSCVSRVPLAERRETSVLFIIRVLRRCRCHNSNDRLIADDLILACMHA